MKLKIKFYKLIFCLFLLSCNQYPDHKSICYDSSLQTNEYLGNLFDLTLLTDLEQALDCASTSEKYLLIAFCSYLPSGIGKTIIRGYRNQLYYFENSQSRNIIRDRFIPLVLYIDDQSKWNETVNAQLLDQIELYYELYNPQLSINFCTPNRTMGNVYSKLQIALTGSNGLPSFAILDQNGKRMYYHDNQSKMEFHKLPFNQKD